jgi:hypothetical protein
MFKQNDVMAVFFIVFNRSGTLSATNPTLIVVTTNPGFHCEKRRLTPLAVGKAAAYAISIAGLLFRPVTSELTPPYQVLLKSSIFVCQARLLMC